MEPIKVSFKYSGNPEDLVSHQEAVSITRYGSAIPVHSISQVARDKIIVNIQGCSGIPIDLSGYRHHGRPVKMEFEFYPEGGGNVRTAKRVRCT